MYFLIDEKLKIIFGWSAKSGCSHIKNIWLYLHDRPCNHSDMNSKYVNVHRHYQSLPNNLKNYTILIFVRNPFKRLVSGFLDREHLYDGSNRIWHSDNMTFSSFVENLTQKNWDVVNFHHFAPQTTEAYSDKIFTAKLVSLYDIGDIDYQFIEKLFLKEIPPSIREYRGKHCRKHKTRNQHDGKPVYDLELKSYIDQDVNLECFYNQELIEKVQKYFENDFFLFLKFGIDYRNKTFNPYPSSSLL